MGTAYDAVPIFITSSATCMVDSLWETRTTVIIPVSKKVYKKQKRGPTFAH